VNRRRARIRLAVAAASLACAAIALWRFTPLADWATADQLLPWLERVEATRWSMAVMPVVYVLAGLVFFPITILIAVTALMFAPLPAFLVAFTGTLANAVVTYVVGAKLLRGTAREAIGPAVSKLDAALETKGIVAIAVIRTLPIAPFTVVNMAAGLLGVRLRDYVIGTAIGISPGVAAFTMFGNQLQAVVREPTAASVLILAAIVAGWIALSLLLQRAIGSRFFRKPRH
jgi:phospholipase D1/2